MEEFGFPYRCFSKVHSGHEHTLKYHPHQGNFFFFVIYQRMTGDSLITTRKTNHQIAENPNSQTTSYSQIFSMKNIKLAKTKIKYDDIFYGKIDKYIQNRQQIRYAILYRHSIKLFIEPILDSINIMTTNLWLSLFLVLFIDRFHELDQTK